MRLFWLALAFLALAGAGTWFLGLGHTTDTPDASGAATPPMTSDQGPKARPLTEERHPLEPRIEASPPSAREAKNEVVPPIEAHPATGVLELTVRDAPTHEGLGAFRTVSWIAGRREERAHEGGKIELSVPFDSEFELIVEAEGHLPKGPLKLQVTAGERRRGLTIDLDRKATLTGIVLTVVDPSGAPVPRIVVAASKKPEPGEVLAPVLWERRCERPDGEYPLPELQPGEYRLDVSACDASGDPLPLQKQTVEARFFGNEQVPLRVQLASGALVRLSVRDALDNLLGTEVLVRISQGDKVLDTAWRLREEGGLARRRGGLPGKGEALLAEPLAPGAYAIEVSAGSGKTVSQPLVLEAGAVAKIRITLP